MSQSTFRPRKPADVAGPEYAIFHGVGVVFAEVKSDTLYSVVAVTDDNKYVDFSNPDLRFSVDMTRTPSRAGKWAKVLIDDRGVDKTGKELPASLTPMTFKLAITSIGQGHGDEPTRGAFVGAVYLERSQFLSLRDKKFHDWPTDPGDYTLLQLTSLAYSNNSAKNGARAGKRYHGFPAKVINVSGSTITLEIEERAGTKHVKIVKDDPATYDPSPPDLALDGQSSLAGKLNLNESGAIFIELTTAVKGPAVDESLDGPKLPSGFGS